MNGQPQHRKRVKHFHVPGHFHELTFSCYRRRPLLTNDTWRSIFARAIDDACQAEQCQLIAMVFMPEHVHLLVLPTGFDVNISRLLQQMKQPTSVQIKEILITAQSRLLDELTIAERPGKRTFRFWQEGSGYDRNLFQSSAVKAAIEYIHENPVRRGLCRRAVDWKWSSVRFYQTGIQDSHLPRLTKPPTEFWDIGGVQTPHSE
ncbi:transposase [Blastopirellula sp. JC732]|uniref:Transposase n=1 Tax=Blastopirellula sediminis TaxID=2894196 RepID=A0A9X1MK83_9BACT|nr:transposase [Blastopirellula sediminis]MCC9608912.1 transposase [Blastopirellula sediminis]MCC9628311.1 transposase [Blastopirellula sediminis]